MAEYIFDLAELPLDKWNGIDADDYLAHGQDLDSALELQRKIIDVGANQAPTLLVARKSTAVYVPLKRNVKYGTVGNDALAVKRALSKAGFGKWGAWGKKQKLFGNYASAHLKAFQKKHKLKVDGVYGASSHRALARYFDSYGRYLMGTVKVKKVSSKRTLVTNAAMFGYSHRYLIHYTQTPSRMYGVRHRIKPPNVPYYEDCSSFATWCYWVAGASDPNGLRYNGQGYTGTLIHTGRRISSTQMRPGDLVFYGHYAVPSHVAIYVGSGRVVSHGSEVGPLLIRWNYRSDVHSIRSYL